MSYIYGKTKQDDGSFFDAVIPNYFDPSDFIYKKEKEDYFLYLGRIIHRKGINIAVDLIKNISGHLKIAGQGSFTVPPVSNKELIEFEGFADAEKRKQLLSNAKALIIPTLYIEPFGGVAVEAMMSGCPVISTDWGAFSETVLHGLTGYRCRTLEQFVWAARNIDQISPEICHKWAVQNYSMDRVRFMYQEYFEMLSSLWTKSGWYSKNSQRKQLSWLDKYHALFEKPLPEVSEVKKTMPKATTMTIQPLEKEPKYALDLQWYTKKKKPGVSFILRAKNEESTIGMAIDSLRQLKIPYEINVVLNQCEDDTQNIVKDKMELDDRINLFNYPFKLGKTGLENQCTPVGSVHSTVWLLNWIMMKGKYQFTFRWDADFIMTSQLSKELSEKLDGGDVFNIPATFSDTNKPNIEPYLWSNALMPRYVRYSLWHLAKFGVSQKRTMSLKSKIIHDSPLDIVKDYWKSDPWWENETRDETRDIVQKIKKRYAELKQEIGDCDTMARASCPKADELFRRIQKIIGTDIDEIEPLRLYTSQAGTKG